MGPLLLLPQEVREEQRWGDTTKLSLPHLPGFHWLDLQPAVSGTAYGEQGSLFNLSYPKIKYFQTH